MDEPVEQQHAPVESDLPEPAAADVLVEQVLVEEVSIDGMCGVY